jgi:putative hemolysin
MRNRHDAIEGRLVSGLAATGADVRAAQQLRYRVFHEELGARLPDAGSRLDRDRFDPWCDHLLVRDGNGGPVVGTYRMLLGGVARRVGGFWSEHEFDLGAVRELPDVVEVGRACVHPSYRDGAVIALLWAGLARYLHASGTQYVIGCASIFTGEDPRGAAAICWRLLQEHLGPPQWRVEPRTAFPVLDAEPARSVQVPSLIRGYLRLGAFVCGEPAWDPDFRTADLLLLLPVARIQGRYARRLARAA